MNTNISLLHYNDYDSIPRQLSSTNVHIIKKELVTNRISSANRYIYTFSSALLNRPCRATGDYTKNIQATFAKRASASHVSQRKVSTFKDGT